MRYCIIENTTGNIVNIVEWDGESKWKPPVGTSLREFKDGDAIHAPIVLPRSITPRQARLALNAAGLRNAVEAAVANAGRDAQDFWEYALEIERNNALLIQLSAAVGITSEQLDDLFIHAATL